MGEFPLALPESGPTVAYGWWDFVPGSSPRFVNRANGAAIRYVGEFDPARVPGGEDGWRLFEYSDPDFSYPLAVRWREESPRRPWNGPNIDYSDLTIDYRISADLASADGTRLEQNFGAYVRVDDACQSVFYCWPLNLPPAKYRRLLMFGGWIAGSWHQNIVRDHSWEAVAYTDVGHPELNRLQEEQGGLFPHPVLAPFSMVSQPWHSLAQPMEGTPENLRQCLQDNPHDWPGLKDISDRGFIGKIIKRRRSFMQSSDARNAVVLTRYFPPAWTIHNARFLCCLLKEDNIYDFIAMPRMSSKGADYIAPSRFTWLDSTTVPRPINEPKPVNGPGLYPSYDPVTHIDEANYYLEKKRYIYERSARFRSEHSRGVGKSYMFMPTTGGIPNYGDSRLVKEEFYVANVPIPEIWPSLSRMLSDAIWCSPDTFVSKYSEDPEGGHAHLSSDELIPPYEVSECVARENAWICGVFVPRLSDIVWAVYPGEDGYFD